MNSAKRRTKTCYIIVSFVFVQNPSIPGKP